MSFTVEEEGIETIHMVEDWISEILVEAEALKEEMNKNTISKTRIIAGSNQINQISRLIAEELKNGSE